jgi:hypothetical protein
MAGEPTLYKGNQSADGWVEYLQHLLEGTGWLPRDGGVMGSYKTGLFDEPTFSAVKSFQEEKGLQKWDDIVGDETWAALLGEGEPYPAPGDDGLAPGTYLEKGLELRFEDPGIDYFEDSDTLLIKVFSVGTEIPKQGELDLFVHLKKPDGTEADLSEKHILGGGTAQYFRVENVTGQVAGEYAVLVQLPQEAGNHIYNGHFTRS